MAEELEEELHYQARFDREVDVTTWCFCSNCSVDFTTKPEECQCCQELTAVVKLWKGLAIPVSVLLSILSSRMSASISTF
ncbi:unnamed protein product [Porites evermanni]|uniref:Uncharacterized protein n=1 Tax=Porites evermanni TaxID=104178 RepID=A0ABN8LT11_9CNID|nr:unnamed protein product [Porites evermanni]